MSAGAGHRKIALIEHIIRRGTTRCVPRVPTFALRGWGSHKIVSRGAAERLSTHVCRASDPRWCCSVVCASDVYVRALLEASFWSG